MICFAVVRKAFEESNGCSIIIQKQSLIHLSLKYTKSIQIEILEYVRGVRRDSYNSNAMPGKCLSDFRSGVNRKVNCHSTRFPVHDFVIGPEFIYIRGNTAEGYSEATSELM
jgi:hypothetical protein